MRMQHTLTQACMGAHMHTQSFSNLKVYDQFLVTAKLSIMKTVLRRTKSNFK